MRRLFEHKATIILLALAGLVGLGLLAAALREVEFSPAGPMPFSYSDEMRPTAFRAMSKFPWMELLILAGLVVFVMALIVVLIDPKARKQLLKSILRFVLTMLAVWWAMEYTGARLPAEEDLIAAPQGAPALGGPASGAQPEFAPPEVNSWLIFAISFGLALGLVAVTWFFYSRRPKQRAADAYDEIAGIAREALAGLQDGRDWDDAIIKAYSRMSEVVTAERGLLRQPGTTPAEFALRMERAGLPGEAARTLTRLFERVRYGSSPSSKPERDLAAAALSAILRACGVNP